jgi:hypothetical protein
LAEIAKGPVFGTEGPAFATTQALKPGSRSATQIPAAATPKLSSRLASPVPTALITSAQVPTARIANPAALAANAKKPQFQKSQFQNSQPQYPQQQAKYKPNPEQYYRQPNYHSPQNHQRNIQSQLPAPPFPPQETAVNSHTFGHKLMELNKLYTNNKRFDGEHYDILDAKLKIFFKLYFRVNIEYENYAAAYSVMLKGKAKKFYYQHITGQNLSFDKITAKTRAFFHTTKNHQMYLNEWRTTMLKNVIATNPDKNLV